MSSIKKITYNYVTCFYLLNIVFSICIISFEYNKGMQYLISTLLILFLGFGGYLNAKKEKRLLSVSWVFILNFILGIASIYAIEILGAKFNILGGSQGGGTVLIVLFQYGINSYLFPFIEFIETTVNESASVVCIIICSLIIPLIGYLIGKLTFKK